MATLRNLAIGLIRQADYTRIAATIRKIKHDTALLIYCPRPYEPLMTSRKDFAGHPAPRVGLFGAMRRSDRARTGCISAARQQSIARSPCHSRLHRYKSRNLNSAQMSGPLRLLRATSQNHCSVRVEAALGKVRAFIALLEQNHAQ
jgi:hypothetical protein